MSDLLQKALREKTSSPNLKSLEAQWAFDQQLIPKALNQISQFFPHYSRHDQSHSDQILVNIERLLGESRIPLLTATDIWLLLEAAYWHDIGMVIPESVLADAIDSPDFEIYRRQVANDKHNDLSHFASSFNIKDLSKAFLGAENPVDATVKFRLLMAEWFRRKHPEQSQKYVNTPLDDLGLNSPRNELIPKRLFRILGQVCALHGASFEDILKQLPHKEVGMANDDCHPRFVACMLRLGDLLDMDDNRFCPIMQRVAGDNRPATSKAHEDKHNSIQHFRLDADRIEVSAVCESVDGYLEQWRWLDYLQDEVKNQMCKWQDIAPSPALGLLPTLGNIRVDIKGRNLLLAEGKRPEFTVNSQRMMELLKGENLYKREDAIRELLQNAVDSTLIHMWLTRSLESRTEFATPEDTAFKEQANQFPISVKLEKNNEHDSADGSSEWTLTISDKGTGISWNDLPYLLNIGSSSFNSKKNEIIQSMPEWLRPSGTFGIGFQSVFMLTDEVQIQSKSLLTNETLSITLNSPTGSKRGLVTVERLPSSYADSIGTKLTLKLNSKNSSDSIIFSGHTPVSDDSWNQHDWQLDDEFELEIFSICDAVLNFSKGALISVNPVELIIDNTSENYTNNLSYFRRVNPNDGTINYFSETNSYFSMDFSWNGYRKNEVRYRGQEIDLRNGNTSHLFICTKLDIYSGNAGDILLFSRNGLNSNGKKFIKKLIDKNVELWIRKNEMILNDEQNRFLSIFSKYQLDSNSAEATGWWQHLSEKLNLKWLELNCWVKKNETIIKSTFNDLLANDYCYIDVSLLSSNTTKFNLPNEGILFSSHYEERYCLSLFAQEWCRKEGHAIRYLTHKVMNNRTNEEENIVLAKLIKQEKNDKNIIEIDKDTLAFGINRLTNSSIGKYRIFLHLALFDQELKYEKLLIKKSILLRKVFIPFDILPRNSMPGVLLPHEILSAVSGNARISLERKDEFINWLHRNLEHPMSLKETKDLVNELIKDVSDLMKDYENWRIDE